MAQGQLSLTFGQKFEFCFGKRRVSSVLLNVKKKKTEISNKTASATRRTHSYGIVRSGNFYRTRLCDVSAGILAISSRTQHSLDNTSPVADKEPRRNRFDPRGDVAGSPAKNLRVHAVLRRDKSK